MAQTVIPWGHPSAQKKWSPTLAVDVTRKSFWGRKFVGKGENNIIEEKMDVAADTGDRVSFDISVRLRQAPVKGDATLEGKEENLRFFSDEVIVDQMRHSVSAGGRMSRKRTVHDTRVVARNRLSDYWKEYVDWLCFCYISGARGVNAEFVEPLDWTGHGGNPLEAPDAAHILYAAVGVSAKTGITSSDKMSRNMIERAMTRAKMMRAIDQDATTIVPVDIDGEPHFVTLMSTYQEHDLRTGTATADWFDIQKAAATAEGRNSPIFKGSLGMVNNVVLQSHESVIRFSDYGAGANLPAARALFMGRQAGVMAYGTPGGLRYSWTEELKDYGNQPMVAAGPIIGMTKTRYNNKDFGVIALDTYAKDPEA